MDFPFLLFMSFIMLVMGCVAWTGYYLGKQAAYIEMFVEYHKERSEQNRQQLEGQKNNDGNHPDSNQG